MSADKLIGKKIKVKEIDLKAMWLKRKRMYEV
jgi:hypothetical protein